MSGQRLAAVGGLVVFAALLTALIVTTTPWRPLAAHAGVSVAGDFTPAEIARGKALAASLRPARYAAMAVGLVTFLLLGITPFGARLLGWIGGPIPGWHLRVVAGAVTVALITRLVAVPFDVWEERVLRRYGLSTQTWPSWVLDQAKSFLIGAGLLAGALLLLYALIRALPQTWWVPAALGGFALVATLSFVYPVAIEPVFNRFTPMAAGTLRSDLLSMARSDRVPVRDVLVADASRRTTALNAYVSGFGATRRIVVYDTLLERARPDEVELVVAHELGHAKRDDVLHGTLMGALGVAAGACGLYLLLTWPPLLHHAGVASPADPRAVALLLALVVVFATAADPVQNLVSRRIEARADVHALNLTRDPEAFIRMQRALAVRNISELVANPVEYALFATHPTAPERIALARAWARAHHVPVPPPVAAP